MSEKLGGFIDKSQIHSHPVHTDFREREQVGYFKDLPKKRQKKVLGIYYYIV